MVVAIIILTVFVSMFIVAGILVIRTLKKTDPKNIDTSTNSEADNAKDFVLAKDFGDFYIDLGLFQYRAIIECGSVNVDLMNDVEQEIVEIGWQRFLNALTYPVTLYVLTRVVDLSKVVKRMEKSSNQITKQFPVTETYSKQYISRMSTLAQDIGHTLQKKKYVVIPYEEGANMSELSDEEKVKFSISELLNRTEIAASNLSGMGITTKILNKEEIFEVLYAVYHRNNYRLAIDIAKEKMSHLFVDGKINRKTKDYDREIEIMLADVKNRIKASTSENETKFYRDVEYVIDNLQNILIHHFDMDNTENLKKTKQFVEMKLQKEVKESYFRDEVKNLKKQEETGRENVKEKNVISDVSIDEFEDISWSDSENGIFKFDKEEKTEFIKEQKVERKTESDRQTSEQHKKEKNIVSENDTKNNYKDLSFSKDDFIRMNKK